MPSAATIRTGCVQRTLPRLTCSARRTACRTITSCRRPIAPAFRKNCIATNYLGDRAQAYLKARKSEDAPFFLTVSFPDPHHPFNPPGKYWDMYKPEQFPVPEAFRRNDWTPPQHVQDTIEERSSGKAQLQGMRTIGVSAREAQEAQALTCGMIACIDDAIGPRFEGAG